MSDHLSYSARVRSPDFTALSSYERQDSSEGLCIPAIASAHRAALAPHFDLINLSWTEFRVMTRGVNAPATELFSKDPVQGLRGPIKEQDELWGLANEPGARIMMHLAACVQPKKSLIIGSGTGLIPVFIAATSANGAIIDAVDLSYNSKTLGGAVIEVPIADREYVPTKPDLTAGYYIKYAKGLGIRPDVTINEHGADSTQFFERLVRTESSASGYDFVFVDGGHSYAQAKIDILYSWALLNPGGVLVIDDFDKSHVPGLEAVTAALHPILDDGHIVFFVGQDDRGLKTQVAFAIKSPEARRPGNTPDVRAALDRARAFFNAKSGGILA